MPWHRAVIALKMVSDCFQLTGFLYKVKSLRLGMLDELFSSYTTLCPSFYGKRQCLSTNLGGHIVVRFFGPQYLDGLVFILRTLVLQSEFHQQALFEPVAEGQGLKIDVTQ